MPLELNINVEGIDPIIRLLGDVPQVFDIAVNDVATTLRNLVIGRTPIGVKPHGGTLKKSWSNVSRTSTGFTFGTGLDYAQILEEGLYPSAGPRTIEVEGGVYSRQAEGGIIGPLLRDETLLNRIATSVVETVQRELNRRA